MRHSFAIQFLLLLPILVFSQERQYVGMHGLLDDKGILYFEYRGYAIEISQDEGNLENEKIIQNILKKNKLGTVLARYTENSLYKRSIVIETENILEEKPNAIINSACYVLENEIGLDIVLFQTLNQRDILLEQEIVKSYFQGLLDSYIQIGNDAHSIDFVGREIILGNLCTWKAPHSVSCKGGQISWAEFPSFQEAIIDLQARVLANGSTDVLVVLSDEDVGVLFEGVVTTARRIVYMAPNNTLALAVYYIAQKVRGRYVSCVLSNYVYNRHDHELSSLLQQIIQYEILPENAINEFDRPEFEEPHSIKNYWSRYNIYGASIRSGVWLPIGNASKLYNLAPAISATFGIPVKRDMAVDINISLAFATSRKEFDYYLDRNYILDAKADMLFGISLRYRYQKEMARNVYFTPYIGMGYHSLATNQLKHKAESDDENNEYYSIGTLDAYGGIDIRFKRFGAFLEYHYTPYHLSKYAKKDLGNSAINTGVYFVLW